MLLIHETTHAEQFAGQAKAEEAEVIARKASYDAFFKVGFTKADEANRQAYEKYVRDAKADADYAKTFLGRTEAFLHGIAIGVGVADRTEFALPKDKLDHIRSEAIKLRDSVEAADAARAAREVHYAPVPPAASRAPERPSPAAPLAPAGRASYEYARDMVRSSCRRDWPAAIRDFTSLAMTPDADLRMLASSAGSECEKRLLERILEMRSHGETITMDRIRSEVDPPPPPVVDLPAERERRRPCVERGIWHKDCY